MYYFVYEKVIWICTYKGGCCENGKKQKEFLDGSMKQRINCFALKSTYQWQWNKVEYIIFDEIIEVEYDCYK